MAKGNRPNGRDTEQKQLRSGAENPKPAPGIMAWWRRRTEWQKLAVFGVIFLLVMAGRSVFFPGDQDEAKTLQDVQAEGESTETTEVMPLDVYEAEASVPTYSELSQDPEAWDGRPLRLTGMIMDIESTEGLMVMRVAVGRDGDSFNEDEYVVAGYGGDEPLSEGDVITFYADGLGAFEDPSEDGSAGIVPSVLVKYLAKSDLAD
ncbi:MAG: hypothetical protein Kow00129_03310 [Thermoleophilia bacterium]